MEEFLKGLVGKNVDAVFGANNNVRGKIIDVKDGIVFLVDEHDKTAYAAVDKITVVWECSEPSPRPGFVI
jgi:hypothetical protein